jgi:transcriptional regulator with XRE-family HTH domain
MAHLTPADFGSRLVAAREGRDFTAAHLANLTGVRKGRISLWENGHQEPSADNIRKLALALNVTADYLLGINSDG